MRTLENWPSRSQAGFSALLRSRCNLHIALELQLCAAKLLHVRMYRTGSQRGRMLELEHQQNPSNKRDVSLIITTLFV